jgi:hypothetical protein
MSRGRTPSLHVQEMAVVELTCKSAGVKMDRTGGQGVQDKKPALS